MTGKKRSKDVSEMTPKDWERADRMWTMAGESLDTMLEEYQEHRDEHKCPHPACTNGNMADLLATLPRDVVAMLLHVAMNRLDVHRLEKEMRL